jgi:hypothetical protein
MARPSIDWLNARHGISRGAIRADRLRLSVNDRARWNELDAIDQAHESVIATFSEFQSWFRNLPTVEELAAGTTEEDWT